MIRRDEVLRIKANIEEKVCNALVEYEKEYDCGGIFKKPVIGYCNAKDPVFDDLYMMKLCDHPSKIYRPGYTIVTFFLPYGDGVCESRGDVPSQEWKNAYREGTRAVMRINRAIREALNDYGRLTSCLNTPLDWNEKTAREGFSHKIAAYLCGMGEFGPAGSFITEAGSCGRFSGIITDIVLYDKKDEDRGYERACAIKEAMEINAGQGRICPAGAFTDKGFDRFACQTFCKSINEHIPSPEVCGLCFK